MDALINRPNYFVSWLKLNISNVYLLTHCSSCDRLESSMDTKQPMNYVSFHINTGSLPG